MTSYAVPTLDPENNMVETFNINYFQSSKGYVTFADLLHYADLRLSNIFQALNIFTSIQFNGSINTISASTFAYIKYIPNIISEITNISYDVESNTTYLKDNTFMYDTAINNNLVALNVNANNITNQTLLTNSLQTNQLILNDHLFIDTSIYIHLNEKTFPLIKTTLINAFNIMPITSMTITIKPHFRADIVDMYNNILFSVTNTTDNYIYNQSIPYNNHMIQINVYNCYNNQII